MNQSITGDQRPEDLNSLMSAIDYIESIDRSNLDLSIKETENEPKRVLRPRLQSRLSENQVASGLPKSESVKKKNPKRKRFDPVLDKENTSENTRSLRPRTKRIKSGTVATMIEKSVKEKKKETFKSGQFTEKEKEVADVLGQFAVLGQLESNSVVPSNTPDSAEAPRRATIEKIKLAKSFNELEINDVSPLMKSPVTNTTQIVFEKSLEISLIEYNDCESTPTKNFDVTSPIIHLEKSYALNNSPMNLHLNMSCHSDTSYNFNSSPFTDLVEELDAQNNLVMKHPKLKSFVVTSDLNAKFNIARIHTESSKTILNDLNTLNEHGLMNFDGLVPRSSSPCKNNHNYVFFRNLFDNDVSFELTSVKASEINMENFTSPLFSVENETEKVNRKPELNTEQDDEGDTEKLDRASKKANQATGQDEEEDAEESVVVKKEEISKKPRRNSSAKKKRISIPKKITHANERVELEYAFQKCHEIFTEEELTSGIFCITNNNGVNVCRSKIRTPLSEKKVLELKEKLGKKFNLDSENLEDLWYFMRPDLNKLIYRKPKL